MGERTVKVSIDGRTARLDIEDYSDLLTVRSLPAYHFDGPESVMTERQHLESVGLADPEKQKRRAEYAGYLFDYQRWVIDRALERRKFAAWLDCGLGKTAIQLEWARLAQTEHGGRTLIVAPLQVVPQTIDETDRWYSGALKLHDLRARADLDDWYRSGDGIGITNYEKLDGTEEPVGVDAVVLDESSIIRSIAGPRKKAIFDAFRGVPWKLCCSATPAPNMRTEYAQHAVFLDVVRSTMQFLTAYFMNRDGDWQMKPHGEKAFYSDLASWSVYMTDPSTFGFVDNAKLTTPLEVTFPHVPLTDAQADRARGYERGDQSSLFGATPGGVTSRIKLMQISNGFEYANKQTGEPDARFPSLKPERVAELANNVHRDEQVIVWVHYDEEARHLGDLIPDAKVISGKTKPAARVEVIEAFRCGEGPRVLIAKPRMLGFGLNLQACRVQVFSTITDSFEQFYQAVRRSHRYGQTRPVEVYVPLTQLDEAICQNTMSKQAIWETDTRRQEIAYRNILRPKDTSTRRILVPTPQVEIHRTESDTWTMVQADCIAHMPTMEPQSVDLCVFSPPFAALYSYSDALGDMGNVKSDDDFRLQWRYFADELLKVMRPGRIVAIHCKELIRYANMYGHRWAYDFPSALRQGMEDAGFHYHRRITIEKNPQLEATRNKETSLLFVTLKRDSLQAQPQTAEYVLTFQTPGTPDTPVVADSVSDREWIQWANSIWYGIRETDVLNAAVGKEKPEERHVCPLQLSLIERCVRLWTNPGELVFSPFAGIGSEGYEALAHGRRFYGIELKRSYYDTACRFLGEREHEQQSVMRLDLVEDVPS